MLNFLRLGIPLGAWVEQIPNGPRVELVCPTPVNASWHSLSCWWQAAPSGTREQPFSWFHPRELSLPRPFLALFDVHMYNKINLSAAYLYREFPTFVLLGY